MAVCFLNLMRILTAWRLGQTLVLLKRLGLARLTPRDSGTGVVASIAPRFGRTLQGQGKGGISLVVGGNLTRTTSPEHRRTGISKQGTQENNCTKRNKEAASKTWK